jgi:transcriptional regulator with XRE-family HTH domain
MLPGMDQEISPLRKAREHRGLSLSGLGKLAKTSGQQIERLEKGQRKLTKEWAVRLAPCLGASPEELLFPSKDAIPVVGYVAAGAQATFFGDGQGALGEAPVVEGATEKTVAVEVRGDSLGSFFDNALVYYDDVRSEVSADMVNKLCIVGLPDGRVLVKRLERSKSRRRGLWNLFGQFGDPIYDVPIEWAARVKNMVPR